MWETLKDSLKLPTWIRALFVFATIFIFSLWFSPDLVFLDSDTFYHIKITELLASGIPRNFIWLPFTSLVEVYIDHHFLYHIFLFPFVKFIGPFAGMKLATMFLASLSLTVFYLTAKKLRLAWPLFFTFLLAISPGFFFRENIAKAPAFSLIFILLGLLFTVKRKPIALFILSFLYVWAYNAWPLLPFTVFLWVLSRSFIFPALGTEKYSLKKVWRQVKLSEHRNSLIGVIAGTVSGMLINPYFPKNLFFYWNHIVKIGIINYQSVINVGAEWHPTNFSFFAQSNSIFLTIFIVSLVIFIIQAKGTIRNNLKIANEDILRVFAFFIIAGIFFVLTLRSRRFIDYSVPLMFLAVSSLLSLCGDTISKIKNYLKKISNVKKNWLIIPPLAVIFSALFILQGNSFLAYKNRFNDGFSPSSYKSAGSWLKNNTPKNSIVFHTNWDTFPLLFYHNDQNLYINGLDSTFMYEASPKLHKLWDKIIYGEYAGDVTAEIEKSFDSHYVLFDKNRDHDFFQKQLELSKKTKKVFEDDVSIIFKLN